MRTQQSTKELMLRKVPKWGDGGMILGTMKLLLTPKLLFKPIESFWNILIQILKFNFGVLAFTTNVFYRRNFGVSSTGFGLLVFGACYITVFNTTGLHDALKPALFWIWPFWKFYQSPDSLIDFATTNIHSEALLIHGALFALLGLMHVIRAYVTGAQKDLTKRGDSWLYTVFSRLIKIDETIITCLIEPGITLGMAYIFWKVFPDPYYATFLALSGGSVMIQQLVDLSQKMQNKAILDT